MFRAFNLATFDWNNAISCASGKEIFERNERTVKASLESFLKDGIIDGTKLSAQWFPAVKADVFLSHSHKDRTAAITCASWLKDTFKLESFIDSCVWGYANDLLKSIDEKYCRKDGSINYDYDIRNRSTSHVHMMLASALGEMLDACECAIFIDSPTSIVAASDAVSKTDSPWIFLELGMMRIIRRKKPDRKIVEVNLSKKEAAVSALQVQYEVPLSELTPLNNAQLDRWRVAHRGNQQKWKHALDLLYETVPEK